MQTKKASRYLVIAVLSLYSAFGCSELRAEARNLSGRLGVGFTNQIATAADTTIPAVSAKYYFSKATAASLGLGFNTRNDQNTLGAGLKFYQNLFAEDNLSFYTGLGLAAVSRNGTKLQLAAFFGSEFFFSGLPSLGFSFEAGVRGDSYSGSFAIRTTGDSFLTGGIHFYF